eukprot:2218408-Pyramimonas_sp.AAC.1
MFADDATLAAKSRQAPARMLTGIADALARVDLHRKESKCSIQCAGMDAQAGKVLKLSQRRFPRCSRAAGFK